MRPRTGNAFRQDLAVLLWPKLLGMVRRGAGAGATEGRRQWGRLALMVGLAGVGGPLAYLAMYRLLVALRGVPEVGPLLAMRLLALGLLVFLGILLLSNLIAALSSFFLARDLPALLATPADWLAIYAARLLETLVSSSWMVLLMLAPILVAYERVYGGGLVFYGFAVAALVPFLIIPAAVGSTGTLLLVRVLPARRTRDILALIGLLAAGILVFALRALRPERLVRPEEFRNLVDFVALLRGPSSPWLPSEWSADVMMGALQAGPDLFFLLLLWTSAGAAVVIGAALHVHLYPLCFTRAQEGLQQGQRRSAGWRALERTLGFLRLDRRELILKDIRVFFRDSTQWSQLIVLAVLVVVYVYNIQVLPVGTAEGITRYLVAVVVFLNLALAGFVLAAIAARFIFPALSLEGRSLWLLRSSPVAPATLLWSKFWVGAVPLTALAVVLTGATNLLLGVGPELMLLSLLSIVAISLTFTGQALAWGTYYPVFEAENAAQIPTSPGGLLFMLGALGTLAVILAAQVSSLRGYLESGLPWRVHREPLPAEIAVAALLTLAICGLAGLVPYRMAVRKLESS